MDSTQIAQIPQDSTGVSNSNVTPAKSTRKRSWFWTLNNYTETELQDLLEFCKDKKYAFQEEKGEDTGTPHLQGVFYSKQPVSFETLRKISPRAHWQVARDLQACVEYCQKQDTRNGKTYVKGFKVKKPLILLKLEDMYPWQLNILKIFEETPDDRTINWIYEKEGGVGKTVLIKYILNNYENVVFLSGGCTKDVINQIVLRDENDLDPPEIVIFGLTREGGEKGISYNALEQIKDGLVNCGKYKGGTVCFNPPHLLVFANVEPEINKLSKSRWNIIKL